MIRKVLVKIVLSDFSRVLLLNWWEPLDLLLKELFIHFIKVSLYPKEFDLESLRFLYNPVIIGNDTYIRKQILSLLQKVGRLGKFL